jgi:predicted DCC family thiol-disulfide oxidoreductase YuxK
MTAEGSRGAAQFETHTLVLYDGVCGLCNRLVAFLIRHDRRDEFRFAPLQSSTARTLLRRYGLNPDDLDSVVVIADFGGPTERALTRSQAALWAIGRVGGSWRIFVVGRVIPLPLREVLYKAIANRRYRIFGKYDECPLPKSEDRHKFLTSSI